MDELTGRLGRCYTGAVHDVLRMLAHENIVLPAAIKPIVNTLKPGAGFNVDPASIDTKNIANYTTAAKAQSTVDFLMNVIPNTVVDAFAKGEILQVRALTNLIGNGVAAIVVSKWERELDHAQMERGLRRDVEEELEEEARLKHAAAKTAQKPG